MATDPRAELRRLLEQARRYLPDAQARPARDDREPGREAKEQHELLLQAAVMRHFRRLTARLRAALADVAQKALIDATDLDFDDPDFLADLIRVLLFAARGGVELFSEQVFIGLDYSAVNTRAAEWARQYAYDLIRGIDETTRRALQSTVSAFVQTPGMTISDVINSLPFDEQRAARIAVTEITRAYAQGQLEAGRELSRQFPDVRVVKQWFTNVDDRVCQICEPLNGKEVGLDEEFSPRIPYPPAHVSCRCWMSTRTRIAD